jgi:uncharacterized membrane protein YfcA
MGVGALVVGLGVVAGMIAGVFGVGGGVVFVPTLVFLVGMTQVHAQATSLLAIIPVAILGTWQERSTGHVTWRHVAIIGTASIATAIAGAVIADHAPERILRAGYALILIWTAYRMAQGVRRRRAMRTSGKLP